VFTKINLIKIVKRENIIVFGEPILLNHNDYGQVYQLDSDSGRLIVKIGFKEGEEAKIPGLGSHRLRNEISFNNYLNKNKLTPKLIGFGELKKPIKCSYLLYKEIDGDNLARLIEKDLINFKMLKIFYFSMGQKLKIIHKIRLSSFGSLSNSYSDPKINWYDFISEVLTKCLAQMELGCFADSIPVLKKYIDIKINLFKNVSITPRLLHGDYEAWNIIVKGEKIRGIIDGEFAFGGHNLIDLVPELPFNLSDNKKKILKSKFLSGYFGNSKLSVWEKQCIDFYYNIKMITHRMVVWEYFMKSADSQELKIERKKIDMMLKEIKKQLNKSNI